MARQEEKTKRIINSEGPASIFHPIDPKHYEILGLRPPTYQTTKEAPSHPSIEVIRLEQSEKGNESPVLPKREPRLYG